MLNKKMLFEKQQLPFQKHLHLILAARLTRMPSEFNFAESFDLIPKY